MRDGCSAGICDRRYRRSAQGRRGDVGCVVRPDRAEKDTCLGSCLSAHNPQTLNPWSLDPQLSILNPNVYTLNPKPLQVVCAGAKSILDIPRTLEYLETLGVPVISYGTDYFPAFFNPSSGLKSQCRMVTIPQRSIN